LRRRFTVRQPAVSRPEDPALLGHPGRCDGKEIGQPTLLIESTGVQCKLRDLDLIANLAGVLREKRGEASVDNRWPDLDVDDGWLRWLA
jgi:hypothetical protein